MAVVTDRFVFLHTPKTGGFWVEKVLNTVFNLQPQTPKIASRHITKHTFDLDYPEYKDVPKIAFVRNPISWLSSFWAYRVGEKWDSNWIWDAFKTDMFSDFIKTYLEIYPGLLTRSFNSFVGSVDDPIEFIGKQETLSSDLKSFLITLNLHHTLPNYDRIHVTDKRLKDIAIMSLDLRREVFKAERELFERFNYTWEVK